jgi:acyl carrier protein
MTKQDILHYLRDILVETFETDPTQIVVEARLREDLDIDSIDAVDLMLKIKPRFGQRLQPEVFKSVRTIGDVVDALYALRVEE